jgi:hypothetical protein
MVLFLDDYPHFNLYLIGKRHEKTMVSYPFPWPCEEWKTDAELENFTSILPEGPGLSPGKPLFLLCPAKMMNLV